MKPCQQCPPGRTTLNDPQYQTAFTDCFVKPGFGVVSSPAAGLAAFDINTADMTDDAKANLVVLECPVGYYGVGGAVDSTCAQCPCGSTTTMAGARNDTDCNGKYLCGLEWYAPYLAEHHLH
jgi:hypothetical protein